jgi:long-chain acyl-CoA synthetase
MAEPSKVAIEAEPISQETVIRAFDRVANAEPLIGSQTVYELLQLSQERHGNRPCLGTRVKSPNSDSSQYQWITYNTVFEMARHLASGLIKLGLQPGASVGIYAQNSVEWVVSMIAAQSASIVIVPLYDVAGPKSIQTLISLTKLSVVISSPSNVSNLAEAALSCHSIKTVILTSVGGVDTSTLTRQGVQVLSFGEVLEEGGALPVGVKGPSLSSWYMVMFTSGDPKGVPMTHRMMTTSSAGIGRVFSVSPNDVYISYLPLVHIMEHIMLLQILISGGSIGFWSGHISVLWDDLKILKPTIFPGVPSVFNRMYDGIHANLLKSNPIRRLLFSYAYNSKKKFADHFRTSANTSNSNRPSLATSESYYSSHSWWDRVVFSKIADGIGGRVRLFVSAAAPLTPQVAIFLQHCFCCPLIQAYGLTETTGALSATMLEDTFANPKHVGTVGYPLECTEVKLVPVPEYSSPVSNQGYGEICVRGANVFEGYYAGPNQPLVRDSSILDEDGWFHTGDIGAWNHQSKTLSIVDSKKSIFKLAQGEYIATESLQSLYSGSIYVSQIAVVGRTTDHYIVAIVVPSRATISRWASQNNINEYSDFAELCRHPAVKRLIFEDLVKCANLQQLRGFQIVRNIHLEPTPWTTENGFLQANGKLNRSKIRRAYKDAIDFLYSQPKMDADHPAVPIARL